MGPPDDHQRIEVESFAAPGAGGRTNILLRPVQGEKFPVTLLVEGNKSLVQDYAAGTRFKVQVSLMKRPTGGEYLFSSWQWDVKVLQQPEAS